MVLLLAQLILTTTLQGRFANELNGNLSLAFPGLTHYQSYHTGSTICLFLFPIIYMYPQLIYLYRDGGGRDVPIQDFITQTSNSRSKIQRASLGNDNSREQQHTWEGRRKINTGGAYSDKVGKVPKKGNVEFTLIANKRTKL